MEGDKITQIMHSAMDGMLQEILQAYENNTTANEPMPKRVTGHTGEGLEVVQVGTYHFQLLGYDYTGTLDYGRRGGAVPRDFADIIREWAIAKGLTFATEEDLNSFAYATANMIARSGTLLYRTGGRTDILQEPTEKALQTLTKIVADGIGEFLQGKFGNYITQGGK